MTLKIARARREVHELIDRLGAPAKMTKREWIEFLSEVETDCAAKREAAEEELRDEDGP